MEHKNDCDTICNWYVLYTHQRVGIGLGEINMRMSRDHPNYSIAEIDQNTEKSPRGMGKLAATQTLVKSP